MKFTENIHFHRFETTATSGAPEYHSVAAIALSSCPSVRLKNDQHRSSASVIDKQIDLINTLYQPINDTTYAIRYIALPDPHSPMGGKIKTCIFCKVTDTSSSRVETRIIDQIEELFIQLCSTFPDYYWSPVCTEEEFSSLWKPLDWDQANLIDIRRREERINLDLPRYGRSLGFDIQNKKKDEKAGRSVYFVHPFLPHRGQLERLLLVLLLEQKLIVYTMLLKPEYLTRNEVDLFQKEISISEGFNTGEQGANLLRVQEHRAYMITQGLVEQSLSLQDAPFKVTVTLAAQSKIPPSLAEAAGVAITGPIGEGANPLYSEKSFLQMGGYDVVIPENNTETSLARSNAAFLSQHPWGKTIASQGLERLRYLMPGQEAVNAFHFPEDTGEGIPGIELHSQRSRKLPVELGPAAINGMDGLLLGENNYLGIAQDVYLPMQDRFTHMYLVGQTGTGKSTLMKTMLLSDIYAGHGCALIDPHGDLFEEIISYIPENRIDDVMIINPADMEYPVGLNLMEVQNTDEKHFIVREMQAIMKRMLEDTYGTTANDYTGPSFYRHMQMNMLLAMSDSDNPGTLLQFYEIFQTPGYWRRWEATAGSIPELKTWMDNVLRGNNYFTQSSDGRISLADYYSSKFTDFVFDPYLRYIFGQRRSTINFEEAMNNKKIILINLAKGLIGEANSRFLGLVLMAKIQVAAMRRAKTPVEKREPFFIFVDEFQNLATENFTVLLSEARKYKIGLILANQFMSQIKDQRITDSILGNVGALLTFRLGHSDAGIMESQFLPYFDAVDLVNLPNWHCAARLTHQGKGLLPFTIRTTLPAIQANEQISRKIIERSRERYGKAKSIVTQDIAYDQKLPK